MRSDWFTMGTKLFLPVARKFEIYFDDTLLRHRYIRMWVDTAINTSGI